MRRERIHWPPVTPCPVCGAPTKHGGIHGDFRYRKCTKCGHGIKDVALAWTYSHEGEFLVIPFDQLEAELGRVPAKGSTSKAGA